MIVSSLPASAFAEEGVAEDAASVLVSEEPVAEVVETAEITAPAETAEEAEPETADDTESETPQESDEAAPSEESEANEEAPDSVNAFEEAPIVETAAPEESPAPTPTPVDAEIAVWDRVAETLSAAQPSYSLRLTVEYNRRLLLRYTGAVGFVLRSEQSDASRPFVNVPDEDGAWPEVEEVLTLTKGSYTLTICPIKPVVDGSSWPFTLVFEPYVEAAPDESVAGPLEEEAAETEAEEAEDAPALIDRRGAEDALWHEDALYLTGLLPEDAVVDAQPVTVEIAGQEAALAYEISIYSSEEQQEKDESWQPEGDTVTVHFAAEGLTGEVDVFHLSDADGRPEYLGTATVVDGWVSFEAARFSVYALTETALTRTVTTGDGATYEITATYAKDAGIPMQGTALWVRELTEDDPGYASYRAASLETLGIDEEHLGLSRAFDIKIVDANDHSRIYEPQSPVEVSIRLIGTELGVGGDVGVAHFAADGGAEALTPVVDGETLRFTTDSFSVYVVNEQTYLRTYIFYTYNDMMEYEEYQPYTEDGNTTVRQTVKNGETPIAPQNPTNLYDPSATFAGWYEGTGAVTNPELASAPYNFSSIPTITVNEEVHLFAVFKSYAYVIFHGQYDPETQSYPIAFTRRVELVAQAGGAPAGTLKISDLHASYQGADNSMVFSGWSEYMIQTPGTPGTAVTTNEDGELTNIQSTTHLYPLYTRVKWLSFYSGPSGSGATYFPDTWYPDGEGPVNLTDRIPTRDGAYTFDGWYAGAALDAAGDIVTPGTRITDAGGNLISDASADGICVTGGRLSLSGDVMLYAKWSASTTANYTVVKKRQKPTDAVDLAEDQKTYEYADSIVLSGTIGNTVVRDSSYETSPYTGYTFNSANSDASVTVLADGSAILNICYDWNSKPNLTGQRFTLTFANSAADTCDTLPVVYKDEARIEYGASLAQYVPTTEPARTGYRFTGWYADVACTLRAFFQTPTAEELVPLQIKTLNATTGKFEWDGHSYKDYVLYSSMPGADLTVYAGWEKNWYVVTIDPNYGAMYAYGGDGQLHGTGATWFWAAYGSKIQEYTTVKRDYVSSAAGTWYYVNHAGDGEGDSVWPDRYTYYTQDPSLATEFGTFAYEQGTYRYLGWHEVLFDEDGNEIGEDDTFYDFTSIVDHDITLRLHWTRIGAFYISYEAGEGTLDQSHENEKLFVELDGETYDDNADVAVTRVAYAPDYYEFVGWTIRGDESGTVYRSGQTFPLLSRYTVTVQGRRTLYLDAVYTRVPTASIVYDANGGTVTSSDADSLNLGEYRSASAVPNTPTPVKELDAGHGRATISNLVNNSGFILSDGTWLSREGASFAGWCKNPVYDPSDEDAPLLTSETVTNVDANEPLVLYAIWRVNVSFHLNDETDYASFDSTKWDAGVYSYTEATKTYSRSFFADAVLAVPEDTLHYGGSPERLFLYWATRTGEAGAYEYERYSFSQPVTGNLDLYACWGAPIEVPLRVVYAEVNGSLDGMELADAPAAWGAPASVTLGASAITLNAGTADGYVSSLPAHWLFAFATVYSSGDALTGLEEKPVAALYYDPADGTTRVRYADGGSEALGAGQALTLVYYEDRPLDIRYARMDYDGPLRPVTVASAAPTTTGNLNGAAYDVTDHVTAPLAWQTDSTKYEYYSYSLGTRGSSNADHLFLITEASTADDSCPALQVRNTWRGFQYSTDNGLSWVSCDYDVEIVVCYFLALPTIVTFRENTVGLPADMDTLFVFDYVIYSVASGTLAETSIYDSAANHVHIPLSHGKAFSTILFTDASATQKVTVTLIASYTGTLEAFDTDLKTYHGNLEAFDADSDAFSKSFAGRYTTTVDGPGANHSAASSYSYTAMWDDTDNLGKPQTATFTNARVSYTSPIPVHVAVVNEEDGSLKQQDGWIAAATPSVSLNLNDDKSFLTTLPGSTLVSAAAHPNYTCGAVFFGTADESGAITPLGFSVDSVAFEAKEAGGSEYGVFLKDAAGNRFYYGDKPLDLSDADNAAIRVYYLYYPLLQLRYVVELDNGVLEPVTGAGGGAITYAGAPLRLNSYDVTAVQDVEMPPEGMLISQSVGGGAFNVSPLLDYGDKQLDLVYTKIGVYSAADRETGLSSIDSPGLSVSEDLTLYMSIANNKLSWSFDGLFTNREGLDGTFTDWPVVYVIYQERGYSLEISKTVPIDTGYDEPFTVTLTSTAINRSKYTIEGTGYTSIAAIPTRTEGGVQIPGTITLEMIDGNSFEIFGLGPGDYTVTESGNDNFILSAQFKAGEADAFALAPDPGSDPPAAYFDSGDGSVIRLHLGEASKLMLTNTPKVICTIGSISFYTLNSAIRYAEDHYASTNRIEMLVDYLLPASDCALIPSYLNISLTTAEAFTTANGRPAIIKRSPSYPDGPMFLNKGTLTLENITLDGNSGGGVEASEAMIRNQGTLYIGSETAAPTLQNVNGSYGLGSVIFAEKGSVNMRDGTITNCSSFLGGAIYATGGDVAFSGGTISRCTGMMGGALYYTGDSTVSISGTALITGNTASYSGGAIHMETGTLSMTGGTLDGNSGGSDLMLMLGGGGAIYAEDASVSLSGGTISGNSGTYGGAVYMNAIQLNVSGSALITGNSAPNGDGGAFYVVGGATVIEGGTISGNRTGAYGNGGALYSLNSSITVNGGTITDNSACCGGALYVDAGVFYVRGTAAITNNSATGNSFTGGGNGGALYAASVSPQISGVTFSGNRALPGSGSYDGPRGNGGALWVGSGEASIDGCSFSGNSAENGAAVFVDTGTLRFDGGTVSTNSAGGNGGAIGVGSDSARLYFSGKIHVTGNTHTTGESASETANVYLDRDSDNIINTDGLDSSAVIGVYVPGTMDDESPLFRNRGVPSCRFATASTASLAAGNFVNDRQSLAFARDAASSKLYWVSDLRMEVYYRASFTAGLPNASAAVSTSAEYKGVVNGMPSASRIALSELASELRSASGVSGVPTTAVFGAAFVRTDESPGTSFYDYVTDMEWDSANSCWKFLRRDGTAITDIRGGYRLVVYFTEPYYLAIENNADQQKLTISGLSVTLGGVSQSVINDGASTGYGYVFSVNEAIRSELYPVTAEDLALEAAESIQLLIPGGGGLAYTVTGSYNSMPTGGSIPYTQSDGAGGTVSSTDPFTVTGTLKSASGGKSTLIFGGARAICKMVTHIEATETGTCVKSHHEDGTNVWEYAFATPKQAAAFINQNPTAFYDKTTGKLVATIQMIADYMIPSEQQVTLPDLADYTATISFTTARDDGYYRYPGTDAARRATVSRADGNQQSFIVSTGTHPSVKDTLQLYDLNFDGKSFSGKIDGGIAKTVDWNVVITDVDFNNCIAENGGGVYISFTETGSGGSLTMTRAHFVNCESKSNDNRQGGGAIWTSAETLSLSDCRFTDCRGVDQGGAIFHRIDTTGGGKYTPHAYASSSTTSITDCRFYNCSSRSGGAVESDAHHVSFTNCHFEYCYSKKTRATGSGGAIATYIYEKSSYVSWGSEYTTDLTVRNCDFEHCSSVGENNSNAGFGGAIRSHSLTTTVSNSSFNDCRAERDGGAICVNNTGASALTVSGCTITDCQSTTGAGGAIYCSAATLSFGTTGSGSSARGTAISGCTAVKDGGGVYHGSAVSTLTATGLTITGCSSTKGETGGGGLFTAAGSVSMTDCSISACSTPRRGGGVCVQQNGEISVTLDHTDVTSCSAGKEGGGLSVISVSNANTSTLTIQSGSVIGTAAAKNTANSHGGGVYSTAGTFSVTGGSMGASSVSGNYSEGRGGGVCLDNSSGTLILNDAIIESNISLVSGGGAYTAGSLTLKGSVSVTQNRLTVTTVESAAGVYMPNGKTLTVGEANTEPSAHILVIKDNRTLDGAASDLRLPEVTSGGKTVNANLVQVQSGVNAADSTVLVVNAKVKGTQFGTAMNGRDPLGFTDAGYVFQSEDGELYGIVDRSDENGLKIVWGSDPICKITDESGKLLYLNADLTRPAVFDRLDTGDAASTATTSAFSTLRAASPLLYNADGTLYTGSTCYVKMLVQEYVATQPISTVKNGSRSILLTTAGVKDTLWRYRGESGTRSRILRDPSMNSASPMFTVKTNLSLQNIILDGGAANGVEPSAASRIITADAGDNTIITLTLGRNSTLQNGASTGNGGGVYINWSATLSIEGGTIRSCSAAYGGGVYVDGSLSIFKMSAGTINRCDASIDGGGLYILKCKNNALISGGTISRCTAGRNGGAVYLSNGNSMGRTLQISGGTITGNHAGGKGGAIAGLAASSSKLPKLTLSGAPYIYGNTSDRSLAADKACNIEMDQTFTTTSNSPSTMIVSQGLIRGAAIGVYVPDESSLYEKHGAEADPFGTFTNSNNGGLNYFINDRNGMKGSYNTANSTDKKIYWAKIYTLELSKQVLSDDAEDLDKAFRFTVELTGTSHATGTSQVQPGTNGTQVTGDFGDMHFESGVATVYLKNGERAVAELLPLGFDYTISEILSEADSARFQTTVTDADGSISTPDGRSVTGTMATETKFIYSVRFSNVSAICKLTSPEYGLLYIENYAGSIVPAVYNSLTLAFSRVSAGLDRKWFYLDGDNYQQIYPTSYTVEMLIPEYTMGSAASLIAGRSATLTTADPKADDGFPYIGSGAAKIIRGDTTASLFTVDGALTLDNIILDGGSLNEKTAAGSTVQVSGSGSLTLGTGVTVQNARSSGDGAGVYLAEGATLNISGAPVFANNVSTLALPEDARNGGAPYATAKQDVYIDGYETGNAASLVVTGNLSPNTGDASGSIWVWAASPRHAIEGTQFARVLNNATGLTVLRNARTDAETYNSRTAAPLYLYGESGGDGLIYWPGSVHTLTVTQTVDDEEPEEAGSFPFTVSGLTSGRSYAADYYTSADGSTWTLSHGENLTAESDAISFRLAHNERVDLTLPATETVTVSEDAGSYQASYAIGSGESVTGSTTGAIVLSADTTVAFTNTRNEDIPAPTGLRLDAAPWALLLMLGLLLLPVSRRRRKRTAEDH